MINLCRQVQLTPPKPLHSAVRTSYCFNSPIFSCRLVLGQHNWLSGLEGACLIAELRAKQKFGDFLANDKSLFCRTAGSLLPAFSLCTVKHCDFNCPLQEVLGVFDLGAIKNEPLQWDLVVVSV